MSSVLLRDLYRSAYGVDVGLYSYGCFDSTRFPAKTVVGRYCSVAPTARRFNGNHGIEYLSLHPYLYNAKLGLVGKECIKRTHCEIEDDVWLGHNSILLPSVTVVGRGAVIAAGAVVTKNVPKYAVVAGNPAKIVKYRFPEDVIEQIERTNWWLLDREEIAEMILNKRELMYSPKEYFLGVGES
ncbi:CatB-related O-acetyltransferase [Zhongshania sp. CAU 1632]|uniref:CatB-related O-acetyltransferase n=2 Tax=Zhongshania aquimaris TaxID=2857107 RepID=A0ABS6VRE6_9GAMM|nr:CatB-related O-acetyltransferase [Zhongshania aquimaris]MBW2940879.1 CatB-related O-acetyltransferase [Zhongshania aquimaris]